MASTYALPYNPATQTHGHGHSRSSSDRSPMMNGQANGASPPRASAGGHHHHGSESNGYLNAPVLSPYAESHDHAHEGHSHTRSTDSTYTLKPFINTRPKNRARGESDLGRPVQANGRKFGFSPIQEVPNPLATAPPLPSP
jgi:zinc transporter 5/7